MIGGVTYVPLTDIGMVRDENQDYQGHDVNRHGFLVVVADGMGGHAGGATASQMAVNHIKRAMRTTRQPNPAAALDEAIRVANRHVFYASHERPQLRGMGSTVVSLLIRNDLAFIAHIGDSRIYLLRDKTLYQLTKDHTIVQRLVDEGFLTPEAAEHHPTSHVLSRSLGGREDVEVEMPTAALRIKEGDIFMLCSDGVTGPVRDIEVGQILQNHEPHDAARLLIDEANARGGADNSTVAIVRIDDLTQCGVKTRTDGDYPVDEVAEQLRRGEKRGLEEEDDEDEEDYVTFDSEEMDPLQRPNNDESSEAGTESESSDPDDDDDAAEEPAEDGDTEEATEDAEAEEQAQDNTDSDEASEGDDTDDSSEDNTDTDDSEEDDADTEKSEDDSDTSDEDDAESDKHTDNEPGETDAKKPEADSTDGTRDPDDEPTAQLSPKDLARKPAPAVNPHIYGDDINDGGYTIDVFTVLEDVADLAHETIMVDGEPELLSLVPKPKLPRVIPEQEPPATTTNLERFLFLLIGVTVGIFVTYLLVSALQKEEPNLAQELADVRNELTNERRTKNRFHERLMAREDELRAEQDKVKELERQLEEAKPEAPTTADAGVETPQGDAGEPEETPEATPELPDGDEPPDDGTPDKDDAEEPPAEKAETEPPAEKVQPKPPAEDKKPAADTKPKVDGGQGVTP